MLVMRKSLVTRKGFAEAAHIAIWAPARGVKANKSKGEPVVPVPKPYQGLARARPGLGQGSAWARPGLGKGAKPKNKQKPKKVEKYRVLSFWGFSLFSKKTKS